MLRIGEWIFDAATRRIAGGGDERKLSPKAAAVLRALIETPGQVWSRDALLERAWPGVTVGEEVLTHAVAEIRKALRDDKRAPRYLETVHKSGYRLLTGAGQRSFSEEESFNPHVYAAYLTACDFHERGGAANTRHAIALFTSVLRADPSFAPAHVGLAKALSFLDCIEDTDLDLALDHCATAHRLKADFAEAFAAQGFLDAVAGDVARSTRHFKAALDLRPDAGETLYLFARGCMAAGDLAPAAVMLERAAILRPEDYHALVLAGKVRQVLGHAQQALTNYRMALPRVEARLAAYPDEFRALCGLVRCLWHLGRHDETTRPLAAVAAHPDPMHYALAYTLAQTGQSQDALDVLENAVDRGWRYKAWLDLDPDFARLRDNRRYMRIAASIAAA